MVRFPSRTALPPTPRRACLLHANPQSNSSCQSRLAQFIQRASSRSVEFIPRDSPRRFERISSPTPRVEEHDPGRGQID